MNTQTPGRAADALRRAVEARIELWRQVGETSEDLDGLAADARDAVRMCAHELTEDLATWQEQARQFAAQERPAPASASQVRRHEAQTLCGHEHEHGGIAYRCERKPHPTDGHEERHRHAARIDAEYAKYIGAKLERDDDDGPPDLLTWEGDEPGDGDNTEVAWGTIAGYGADL